MSERKHSDTLEQRRKAQKDFLELKKMQNGEISSGPKPSEVAVLPKTLSEKAKNYWYHYKWLTIIGVFLAVVIIFMSVQTATRTRYDLKIMLYTYTTLLDSQTEDMGRYFETLCDDINGDGEVHIQVINCSYSNESNDRQYALTMNSKLQVTLLSEADTLLYITDEASYAHLSEIAEESLFEDEPTPLGETFYSGTKSDNELLTLPSGLQISLRKTEGMAIEKDKDIAKYLKASKKILASLK